MKLPKASDKIYLKYLPKDEQLTYFTEIISKENGCSSQDKIGKKLARKNQELVPEFIGPKKFAGTLEIGTKFYGETRRVDFITKRGQWQSVVEMKRKNII